MKKNIILYVLLIFLILVNGFFLFNYMGINSSTNRKGPQSNKDFIVKELGFTTSQLDEFKDQSKGHHKRMMRMSDKIKNLKDELFGKLSDTLVKESTIDSITSLIGNVEKEKEKEVYYHFKMIQQLSTEAQKETFKAIIMDALRKGDQRKNGPQPGNAQGHRPPRPN
ncbi:hypothetical protein [Bizionia paragorgiae]|uniref:hypothetical protein n=1 Tax=Flavobacteriaceae TaxID=49546 RepID=UPI003A9101BD